MGSGAYDESQLLAEIAILRKKLAEQDMKLTEIEMKLAEKDKMIREISELTEGVTGVSFKVSVDSEYARVAHIHSNSDLVIPTLRHIHDKKEMFFDYPSNAVPAFMLIQASTGMGKTQLAMTLACTEKSFYYFLSTSSVTQTANAGYVERSNGLHKCISRDIGDEGRDTNTFVEYLSKLTLFTFGYMLKLLQGEEGANISIRKASCSEVKAFISTNALRPIIFIDDYNTKDANRAQFIRNVCWILRNTCRN